MTNTPSNARYGQISEERINEVYALIGTRWTPSRHVYPPALRRMSHTTVLSALTMLRLQGRIEARGNTVTREYRRVPDAG